MRLGVIVPAMNSSVGKPRKTRRLLELGLWQNPVGTAAVSGCVGDAYWQRGD